jgi:hypothetical protein
MIARRTFLDITAGGRCGRRGSGLSSHAGGRSRPAARHAERRYLRRAGARRLVIEPFEKETGARVEVVPASAVQIITRLLAERAAPSVVAKDDPARRFRSARYRGGNKWQKTSIFIVERDHTMASTPRPRRPICRDYNREYSVFAFTAIGLSESASFHCVRKS